MDDDIDNVGFAFLMGAIVVGVIWMVISCYRSMAWIE